MIEVCKLTLADALLVVGDMGENDRIALRAVLGAVGDEPIAVSRWQTEGPAWTLLADGAPIAIFGLSMNTKWSATAWLISTPAMHGDSWRKLIRHCRTVLFNMKSSPIHRIEAHVLAGWDEAERFVKHLGGTLEGTRRKAGKDGQDVQIWSFVR